MYICIYVYIYINIYVSICEHQRRKSALMPVFLLLVFQTNPTPFAPSGKIESRHSENCPTPFALIADVLR